MEAKFVEFTSADNWVRGTCGDFIFTAKLYDEPSGFGINEGRVSKLSVIASTDMGWSNEIINYDRGWDIEPATDEHKEVLKAILELCENSPKRFECLTF